MADTVQAIEPAAAKPLWRRIADFPLVTMVIALVAVNLPLVVLSLASRSATARGVDPDILKVLTGLAATVVAIVLFKYVVGRLGEAPRDDLPFDLRWRDFARGTVGAAILMSVIVGGVAILGGYAIAGWGGSTTLPEILLMGGLQAAFVEEILVRGIIFRFLEEFGGSWFALALSSALFGLGHLGNDNATVFSSLAIALEAGIMLGGAYMLTRNLWLAIGIHFGWNVTQGYIWDVPVSGHPVDGMVDAQSRGNELISGGAFGVEASVVALVLATAVGVWFVVQAARWGHVMRPWWVRRRLAREAAAAAIRI